MMSFEDMLLDEEQRLREAIEGGDEETVYHIAQWYEAQGDTEYANKLRKIARGINTENFKYDENNGN